MTFLVSSQFFKIYSRRTTNPQCFQGGDQLILNDIYFLKNIILENEVSHMYYVCKAKHGNKLYGQCLHSKMCRKPELRKNIFGGPVISSLRA